MGTFDKICEARNPPKIKPKAKIIFHLSLKNSFSLVRAGLMGEMITEQKDSKLLDIPKDLPDIIVKSSYAKSAPHKISQEASSFAQ